MKSEDWSVCAKSQTDFSVYSMHMAETPFWHDTHHI